MPADELQRIAQGLNLALARFVGKQVELEGAAGVDHDKTVLWFCVRLWGVRLGVFRSPYSSPTYV